MFEFRPPIADDFRRIELSDYDQCLRADLDALADRVADIAGPYALTCLHNGKVAGIGGILPSGEAWQFFSRDCRRSMLAMLPRIRQAAIDFALTHGDVWAIIDADRPNARRWAAVLGFDQVEGSDIWRLSSSALLQP